jgi:nickel-dependent lactate racemase
MSQVVVTFPYSDTALLSVRLDESNLGEVIRPQAVTPVPDEDAAIAAALDAPLGTPRLEDSVAPGDRVLILSDDNTRPTPVHRILPHVLARLQRAGVREQDVRILIASGSHRPMSDEEIRAKVGDDVVARIPTECHRCDDPASLYRAGSSREGVEVWLNRALLYADFVLGIGNVVPHPHPGWSGGAKILYPGVAGAQTVGAFHLVGTDDPTNYLGREDAPARRSLEALADTAGLKFVINTVLTSDQRLYGIYCGHLRQAQAAAQRASRAVYGVPVQRRYDIVISNSYPAYLEFWQAGKGIFSADLILRPGGTVILTAPCPEGVGVTHPRQVEYLALKPAEILRRIAAGQIDDPIAAAVCAKVRHVMERVRVSVVSEGLSPAEMSAMGLQPFASVDAALAEALARYGHDARVAIITHGGETVPYLV